ncbi:MAG: PKD domain-containing protein [Saprospiraceae bacterium]
MKTSGIKISLGLFFAIFIINSKSFAQIQCPCSEDDCGVVVSSFKLVSDSIVVCDGYEFEVQNNSTGTNIDYFIWDWGDGTRDSVNTTANQKHTYYISDQIVCDKRKSVFEICLLVAKNCGSNSSCHSNSSPVTVIHRPVAHFNFANSVCVDRNVNFTNQSCNANENLSDAYLWTFHDGTTSTSKNTTKTYTIPGIYLVKLKVKNDCGDNEIPHFIEVVDYPDARVDISVSARDSLVCVGNEIMLIDTSNQWSQGNIWTFPNTPFDSIIMGNSKWELAEHIRLLEKVSPIDTINRLDTLVFTVKTPGIYTFRLTSTNACGTSNWIFPLEVVTAPTINLPTPPAFCESGTYTPGNVITGDVISVLWSFPGGNPSSSTQRNPGSIFYSTPGTYIVTITVIAVCDTILRTTTVVVNPRSQVEISDLNKRIFCQGSSPDTLIANLPGGLWTGQGITNQLAGIFNPTGLSPGNFIITYTHGITNCSSFDTIHIRIVPSENVVVDDGLLCENSPPTQLIANPASGIWSGIPAVNSMGIFDPVVSGIGDFNVMYQYEDVNDCLIEKQVSVTVESFPVITSLDTAILCSGTGNLPFVDVLQIMSNPGGGSYEFFINSVNAGQNIDLAGYTNRTIRVDFTYTRNACLIYDTAYIRFIDKPVLEISPDTVLCIDIGSFTLQSNLPGGTWSGPGINSNSGSIDLNLAGQGIHIYMYIFEPSPSCSQGKSVQIEIKDPGINLTAGSDEYVCEGTNVYQLTGFSPPGGIWSGIGITGNGVINTTSLIVDSFYVYTYCLTENTGDICQACRTKEFIVRPLPQPLFIINGTTCIGEDITFVNQTPGNNSILFDFGDTSFSTNNTSIHQYSNTGNYLVTLTVTDNFGCSESTSQNVYVTTRPISSFLTADNEGCAPFSLIVQNTSSGDGLSYEWLVEGTIYTTQELPMIIFDNITKDSFFVVQLSVTNLCGVVIAYDSILVHPYPLIDFGVNVLNGCSPLAINISNVSLGNPDTYFWDYGNGKQSFDSLPESQVYLAVNDSITQYTITLIGTNECGEDSLSKTITVYPPDVTAFIENPGLSFCQYDSTPFRAFSTPGAINTWQVIKPDGSVYGESGDVLATLFDQFGLYTIILFADRCGTDTDTVIIEVLPAPDVDFVSPEYACQNETVTFLVDGIQIAGTVWDYGDGTSDNTGVHIYSQPGDYEITLTVYSLVNNCPLSVRKNIRIVGLPTSSFTPSVTNGCAPLEIIFTNQSMNGTIYNWSFGDMTSNSNQKNPIHTFYEEGTFKVTLTVYDTFGCFTDTSVLNIIVYPKPVSEFTFDDKTYCHRYDTVQFVNQSDAISGQEWFVGSLLGNTYDYQWFPQDSGNYEITLIVFNNFGCRDSSVQSIDINSSPISLFTWETDNGCKDLEINFENESIASNHFIWEISNGTRITNKDFQYVFTEGGLFDVSLISISDNGCPNDTFTKSVTVHPKPIASFDFVKDDVCGVPMNVSFTDTSSDNISTTWILHDNNVVQDPFFNYEYTEQGDFLVSLIVSSEFNCSDTISKTVPIYLQPNALFEVKEKLCEEEPFIITNLSENANAYIWNIDGLQTFTSSELPILNFDQSGEYHVELIAIYNEFCKDTFKTNSPLKVFDDPMADFSFTTDYDNNILGEVTFTNESLDYNRSFWDLGDGQNSEEDSPVHEYDINRNVDVMLIVFNYNDGLYTCSDTLVKPIAPEWITTFFAPNAFSPEYGTGDVQIFKPVGTGLQHYKIVVYSPWGEAVWSSDELENNAPSRTWNGYYKDSIVPQGAYSWIADITFVNGIKKVYKGSVTVLR